MALHISEIGVRLSVGDPSGPSASDRAGHGTGGASGTPPDSAPPGLAPHAMNELVDRCVRQVLARLKQAESR